MPLLGTFTGCAHVYKTADQTAIGTSLANVTDMGFPVEANANYAFEFYLICDSDATTTGIDVSLNGPASPTNIDYLTTYWTSATAFTTVGAVAYQNDTASTASNGTSRRIFTVFGILRNGANAGTLIPQAKRENVGTGPNVRAGSYGFLWRMS